MTVFDVIRSGLDGFGLNLIAAVSAERYDSAVPPERKVHAVAPQGRSIVVVGNGGRYFWYVFQKHCAANPGWMGRDNPLDDFTRWVIEDHFLPTLERLEVKCKTVYPFSSGVQTLNFLELGRIAGLGGPSIVGVLVHPIFGPWIALRAALVLELELDAPGEALGFDPCPSCTVRSCMSACPVGAVTFPRGWDVFKCVAHRVEDEPDCATRCHARVACVLGPDHRYVDQELSYHQKRALSVMRPYYLTKLKPSSSRPQ